MRAARQAQAVAAARPRTDSEGAGARRRASCEAQQQQRGDAAAPRDARIRAREPARRARSDPVGDRGSRIRCGRRPRPPCTRPSCCSRTAEESAEAAGSRTRPGGCQGGEPCRRTSGASGHSRAQGTARCCRRLRCACRSRRGRQWFRVRVRSRAGGSLASVVVDGSHAADAVALLHSLSVSGTLLPPSQGERSGDRAHYSNGAAPAQTTGLPQPTRCELATHLRGSRRAPKHSAHMCGRPSPRSSRSWTRLLASTAVVTSGWQEARSRWHSITPTLTFLTTDGDRFSADGWTVGVAARGLTVAVVDEARAKALEAARAVGAAEVATETAREVQLRRRQSRARTIEEVLVGSHHERAARSSVRSEQNRAVSDALEEEMEEADPERALLEERVQASRQRASIR